MNPAIRAVWTDFGGVLTPPVAQTLATYCDGVGVEVSVFQDAMRTVALRYGTTDVMAPLDTPVVDQRTWEADVAAAILASTGQRADISGFPRRWFADRAVNEAWIGHLRDWRARGVFVGLLSNMPPAWDAEWRQMVDPGLFDGIVLSHDSGCRKPQAAIFRLAAQRAGVPPNECVLVDDLPGNCDGALAAGWAAVHFTDATAAADLVGARLPGATGTGPARPVTPVRTGGPIRPEAVR